MLKALHEYAQRHGIVTEPGFAPRTVRWAISFAPDGRFLGAIPLGPTDEKERPKGLTFPVCPDLMQSEMVSKGGPDSHFLIETADAVARLKDDHKTRRRHDHYVRLLREASAVMPELSTIADALTNPDTLRNVRDALERGKVPANDPVTVGFEPPYPVESDAWHDWWREFRARNLRQETQGVRMQCFLGGDVVEPVATHPKIKGVVGGLSMGSTLIGFDKKAFTSYGLDQSLNCAVSEEAAWAYRNALNQLVETSSRMLAGAQVVYWFLEALPPEDNVPAWLHEPPKNPAEQARESTLKEAVGLQAARDLLAAIQEGNKPNLSRNRYYALALSGADGRVMVRALMEGRFEELVCAVNAWFKDLEIVNIHGNATAGLPGLERIVTCLLLPKTRQQKYGEWVKPVGAVRIPLWLAAIRNERIPHGVLSRLVPLHNAFIMSGILEEVTGERNHRDYAATMSLLYARMGLLRAYHVRKHRQRGDCQMAEQFTPYLNEDHPEPAYHCGRLMAVLAALQRAALGDVGAGVIQRYYAAACTTPGLVLGRLVKLSQFHLTAVRNKRGPGLAGWFENQLAAIWGRIKDVVPSTLSLEEQSLFALGYYQQLADLRPNKVDRQEGEPADEDADLTLQLEDE